MNWLNPNLNNPWLNLGIGLLSQPTMGQGLQAGLLNAQNAHQAGLREQFMQQETQSRSLQDQMLQAQLAEHIRKQQLMKQFGGLLGGNAPPALLQRPDLPEFKQGQMMGILGELDPGAAMGLLNPKSDLQGDVKQYTDALSLGLIPRTMTFEQYLNQIKKPLVQNINAPSGYRMTPEGGLEFIPGGPADPNAKPPTESQSTTALYTDRAYKADATLNDLEGKYDPYSINLKSAAENAWLLGPTVLGPMANTKLSPEDQRAEQAQRDFVNAILRRESGAVINPDEFKNAKQQYFPQPGDSPDVIRQKAENRRTAIDALKRASGPGYAFPAVRPPIGSFDR